MAKKRKPRPAKDAVVRKMLGALTGQEIADTVYLNRKVYGRKGSQFAKTYGRVTHTSICPLDGCGGCRLHVRWSDGHYTYVCLQACKIRSNKDKDLEIA